jgi:hypothetical protein
MIPGMASLVNLTPFSEDERSQPFALRSRNVPIEQGSPATGEWFDNVAAHRWIERNTQHDTAIIRAGRTATIIVDGPATLSVATWAYSHAAQLGAPACSRLISESP